MTTGNLLLLLLVLFLVFGGGGYYFGPWRPAAGPNNIIGLVVTVAVIALVLRLFGFY